MIALRFTDPRLPNGHKKPLWLNNLVMLQGEVGKGNKMPTQIWQNMQPVLAGFESAKNMLTPFISRRHGLGLEQ
jgi:hypothetical protein